MSVKKRGIASPLDLQPTMNYGFWSAFDDIGIRLGKAKLRSDPLRRRRGEKNKSIPK
jgi:hypothetical protein